MGEKRKLKIFPKIWPLVFLCRGLVDVDSVDQLYEELLHLQETQIKCGSHLGRGEETGPGRDGCRRDERSETFISSNMQSGKKQEIILYVV